MAESNQLSVFSHYFICVFMNMLLGHMSRVGNSQFNNLDFLSLFQHTDLSQYLEKHPGGLNAFNIKVKHMI